MKPNSCEKDLYWAVRAAQSDGLSLEKFLILVKELWIDAREEQLSREKIA